MKRVIWLLTSVFFTIHLHAAQANNSHEVIDIAELIIHLASGIASDLMPPSIGSERVVTAAHVVDTATSRVYVIEGKDIYHTGRVLRTYSLRLSKEIANSGESIESHRLDAAAPMAAGRALAAETQALIGALLNGVYDLTEMSLEHRKVVVDRVTRNADEDLQFEIIGVNQVCHHVDLNTFKLVVSRYLQHERPSYVTELTLPYNRTPVR